MSDRIYIAIDLKSFYASVECIERGLDPLNANLVVADESRTEKTICLAVTPSLKAYGIPGRARLFEVNEAVRLINAERRGKIPDGKFTASSIYADELNRNPRLSLDFVIAPPQMSKYMFVSRKIYSIYLRYISAEDIHVYSVDEVFIDVTDYLTIYRSTPRQLAEKMISDIITETGITATAGIGTNMYLCKVAMDIVAKHIPADEKGVRIAELDEKSYREKLWSHRPLTSFWRVGGGYARKLEAMGLYTMGDIARFSLTNSEALYKKFGINAELLIDHAWGVEPTRMCDIKGYKTDSKSLSIGQVLQHPYTFEKGLLIVKEMTDSLTLDLVDKGLVTDQMVLTVGYDIGNVNATEIEVDRYGRAVPKQAHGSINLGRFTSSTDWILANVTKLYQEIVDRDLFVRRMYVVANHVVPEDDIPQKNFEQLDLFADNTDTIEAESDLKEKQKQKAILEIKRRFGKNSIVRGMNLEEGATGMERNGQVGGHKA